jgi:hypothetical protein
MNRDREELKGIGRNYCGWNRNRKHYREFEIGAWGKIKTNASLLPWKRCLLTSNHS